MKLSLVVFDDVTTDSELSLVRSMDVDVVAAHISLNSDGKTYKVAVLCQPAQAALQLDYEREADKQKWREQQGKEKG